jgi:hypothetical protein
MDAVFSKSSDLVHACDTATKERGFYSSLCGKMQWQQDIYGTYITDDHPVSCSCCMVSLTRNQHLKDEYRNQEAKRLQKEHSVIRGAMQLILNQAAMTVMEDPLGVSVSNREWRKNINNSQPVELYNLLARAIRKSITFNEDGIEILAKCPEVVSLIRTLPIILDNLVMNRVFDKSIDKRRTRSYSQEKISKLEEAVTELETDLAETEEANEKIISENDELKARERKMQKLLWHEE